MSPVDGEIEDLDDGALDDGEVENQPDTDVEQDDAEQSDDVDDGDDEHPSDPDEAAEQPRPVSRAQARVETALREAKAAREEAELARREASELRASQTRETAEARERQALENMDPYERSQYEAAQRDRQRDATIARLEFTMADSADRTDFASKAARIPALALVADEVEAALAAMRQGGTTAPRETIAKYLLGERALARGAGNKTRAAKAGAARIERAVARPTGARSDVRAEGPRGDTKAARAARLKDISI